MVLLFQASIKHLSEIQLQKFVQFVHRNHIKEKVLNMQGKKLDEKLVKLQKLSVENNYHMKRITKKLQRQRRVRGKIIGTDIKPRLSVFRSNNHIYAQLI